MKKISIEFPIKIIIFLLSCGISIFMLLNTDTSSGYEYYFIIPLIYGILNIALKSINYTNFKNIGPTIFNYTMVLKYVLTPLIMCIGNYYSYAGILPSNKYIRMAIWLNLFEMIALCLFNSLFYKKIYLKNDIAEENTKIKHFYSKIIYFVVIILGILVILFIPQTIADYRLIFNNSNLAETIKIEFPLSGLFRTIVLFARYSLVLLIIDYFYKRNEKKKSKWNIILSFLPVILNCMVVSNLSRINILVPIVTFSVLIMNLYSTKKERKLIIKIFAISGIIMISYLSFFKFFGTGRGKVSNSTSYEWWGDTLNMYFSGPKETAVGIKAIDLIESNYGLNRFKLLLNDLSANVIVLSNLANSDTTSTVLFNCVYFGKDISRSQIVPNMVEGVYYFGWGLSWIWEVFFLYLAYKFSIHVKKNNKIDKKFAYLYASLHCGMLLMINTNMIVANLINITFLFLIVTYFNGKVKNKKVIISEYKIKKTI